MFVTGGFGDDGVCWGLLVTEGYLDLAAVLGLESWPLQEEVEASQVVKA